MPFPPRLIDILLSFNWSLCRFSAFHQHKQVRFQANCFLNNKSSHLSSADGCLSRDTSRDTEYLSAARRRDKRKTSTNHRTSLEFTRRPEADKRAVPPMMMWFSLASSVYLWPRIIQHCSLTYIKCKHDSSPRPLLLHFLKSRG